MFLTPGVSGTVSINYDDMRYSVNGARVRMLDTLVDGVAASHPTVNGAGGVSAFLSVEAISEFKVMGANPPAEFGRSQGSILNVVYRSGTNGWHGSAMEFLRNSEFDANSFFSNKNKVPLGSFKRNQYGLDVSGPVRKDKTFFLFDMAGLRERSVSTTTQTVPTALERTGDFSKTLAANGNMIVIYNPTGLSPLALSRERDSHLAARPGRANVMKYFPLPTSAGNPITGANNYYMTGSHKLNVDQYDGQAWITRFRRIKRSYARFSHRTNSDDPGALFPEAQEIAEGRVITENHMKTAWPIILERQPTTILNFRGGFSRTLFVYNNQGLGFRPSQLGLPARSIRRPTA